MNSPSAFHRLHPQLRHGIVHELGWRSLRPVQELAVHAVLDGANAIVLAPTAGGKTEASLFPVLSRILEDALPPVSALYLCPIRALLNNQEDRVRGLARMVGLDAFKWHGDVAPTKRARFLREPAHILMTTPESLEVMLISQKRDARSVLKHLSMVVIDEVHAFAGDDRGAHLMALLERLTQLAGRDLQRVGLSATVGNPEALGAWIQGSSTRPSVLVDPPRPPSQRRLVVDWLESPEALAAEAGRLAVGKKSLVFVQSRAEAERVAAQLDGRGIEVAVHHSAVSRADRQAAEERFASGSNTAIVCTSTMELGLDVGDLDLVLQVDAPTTVASLLQRVGRTGRREGTIANCTFLCQRPEAVTQAIALVRLAERGWVESIGTVERGAHVLAHQVLALTLQEGGLSRHRVLDWVAQAAPFRGLSEEDLHGLVDTMVARDILHEGDGVLSLGTAGERAYGHKHFFELYSVFSSPPLLRVLHGGTEVGTIQSLFARHQEETRGPLSFRLGGRAWQVTHVEWEKGLCHVRPAEKGRVPSWLGLPMSLSYALCMEMKRVLAGDAPEPGLTDRAQALLTELRAGYAGLLGEENAPLEAVGDDVQWHTFAGAQVNRLLAQTLEARTGRRWVAGNLSLKVRDASPSQISEDLASLQGLDWDAVAREAARNESIPQLSKFQQCLPEELEAALIAERLYDPDATRRFLEAHRVPLVTVH